MMISKSEVKYIQSLCHKKQRQEEGLFIAEGPKVIDELLQSNYCIEKIFALHEWIAAHPQKKIEVAEVTEVELEKMSAMQTPNQVLAIARQQKEKEPLLKGKLSLLLDGIQDPGNLGTIIRIADWFGIENVICSSDTVELYNPKTIQGTMGSFVRVNVMYVEINTFLSKHKLQVYGALLEGKNVYEVPSPQEGLLLIGNESKGIRENTLSFITDPITIPKKGLAESLNAAVATGIILSQWVK